MGIDILTPPEEIARIPATGPVAVANHLSGLVDGMIIELVNRVRLDFKILTRSLLTGIPEVEEFMIPVPFLHEENARELGLAMREDTMKHLRAGRGGDPVPGRRSRCGWWGPGVEGEWNVFTHKIVRSTGATILPIYFGRAEQPRLPDRQSGVRHDPPGPAAVRDQALAVQTPAPGDRRADPCDRAEGLGRQSEGIPAWLREHTLNRQGRVGANPPFVPRVRRLMVGFTHPIGAMQQARIERKERAITVRED
ncbi:MAG: hypothetical protein R3D56_03345 [Paracoccaceae bacterium]